MPSGPRIFLPHLSFLQTPITFLRVQPEITRS